jgi:hypothetical protein
MEAGRFLHSFGEFTENAGDYGLALMVDRGTGCGPASSSFSSKPKHAADDRPPLQGMPCTSGTSGLAAVVVTSGEFGTRNGVHVAVKMSCSSPPAHCASGLTAVGVSAPAITGAAAAATAKVQVAMNRRSVDGELTIA